MWNSLKKKINEHKVLAVILLELALLCGYGMAVFSEEQADAAFDIDELYANTSEGDVYTCVLQEETAGTIQSIRTREIPLNKGIYDIVVEYETTNGGYAEAGIGTLDELSIYSDTVLLDPAQNEKVFQIWVNNKLDHFWLSFQANGGSLTIKSIQIQSAWNSQLYLLTLAFVAVILLDMILFGFMFREKLRKHSFVICGILGITFICSVGLFIRYLLMGHDAMFHMNRIEGLKDGLLSGAFPVRIQPTWNNGWGYAVSVLYGDLTILFPALLRICGFTVQASWKAFITAVNLLTAVLAYYSFYQISKNKYKAMLVTLLYCTGIYRLICIYVRAAVGEFTVMAFLPLTVLGFWYAFAEDIEDAGYGKRLLAPVIGFTGMLQTHVLTCEMSAFFIVLLCAVMLNKVLRRKTFTYLVQIVVVTVLVNLWFLVPFLQFLGEELVVCRMSEMREDFQLWGLSIAELFTITPSRTWWFTFGENVSLANKCTFTVGIALWIGVAAVLYLLWNKKLKFQKAAAVMLTFGLMAAFMTTGLFPYQMIRNYAPGFAAFFSKIQFSYRFLGMTGLFFCLAILFAILCVYGESTKHYLKVVLIGTAFLAAYQGMDYQYQILYSGMFDTRYSGAVLDTTYLVSGEYLYENTSVDVTKSDQIVIGTGAEVIGSRKEYLETSITCKVNEKNAYIEIPVFYYPGYMAVDETGKDYEVSRSENNGRIRVELPEGFEGTITVSFREPLYWRICEIVSLVAFLGLIVHEKRVRDEIRRKKKEPVLHITGAEQD